MKIWIVFNVLILLDNSKVKASNKKNYETFAPLPIATDTFAPFDLI